MDNRGFPTGAPIGEGKGAFSYQAMNGVGGYPGMCYSGQEMVMPYGQYGATPTADAQFNEQCGISQQVPQAPANVPYSFGPQAHQYMQHYRQQAHIMQAAYSNAQHQNCVTNPQQIADSIYNIAAHAYNYQQHQNPQLPQAPNSYSPKSGGRNMLSVRTGQSPANSIHSPAGSTHSIGERPMLSPHVQSNAQIYNYHQPNQQAASRLAPSQQQPQQQHVSNMNYYSNNNGHPTTAVTPAVNGCMNAELDHRRSIERLAAISHPTEQFSHNHEVSSPVHTNKVSQYYQPAAATSNPSVTVGNAMAAPVSACQHRTEVPKHGRQPYPTNNINSAEVIGSPNTSNQQLLQSKPSTTTVTSPGEMKSVPNTVHTDIVSAPSRDNSSVSRDVEPLDEDMKPKEAAVDSGIDSEQVDKDNDEEHDTSTTSNRSETSPQPHKAVDMGGSLLDSDRKVVDSVLLNSERVGDSDRSVLSEREQPTDSGQRSCLVQSNMDCQSTLLRTDLECISPTLTSPVPSKVDTENTTITAVDTLAESGDTNKLDHKEPDAVTENVELKLNSSLQESELSESFSSQVSSSLCSSGASKQSMGDESRLPPRKRKQKLSEHTRSLKAAMPLKKRGRPSKEALRLREAAKFAESQQAGDMAAGDDFGVAAVPLPVKERKPSISSASKIKKPVHSGSLLHSPKLNLAAKEEHTTETIPQTQTAEKSESDPANFSVHSTNKVTAALPLKSNAVLVSPPRKPKASVNEMEKALMRVVSSDGTSEIYLKKKRGRPPGSKNRKSRILDQRARSNSASSTSKGQFKIMSADSSPGEVEDTHEGGDEPSTSAATNTSSSTLSQSHKLSLSVQNRTKSLHYRKYKSVSPKSGNHTTELKLPVSSDQWVCTFCQHISNYRDMGDLFGGYNIEPCTPVPAKVFSHKKSSDLRQLYGDKSSRPNEIWFHERCIKWSPGVYMLAGKLYGVYEALTAAFQTTCSSCKKKGAILGCFCKGCSQRYHVHCAELAECTLNEENFSMLCTKHKDTKIVLM